jgi:hypothetical protein
MQVCKMRPDCISLRTMFSDILNVLALAWETKFNSHTTEHFVHFAIYIFRQTGSNSEIFWM